MHGSGKKMNPNFEKGIKVDNRLTKIISNVKDASPTEAKKLLAEANALSRKATQTYGTVQTMYSYKDG